MGAKHNQGWTEKQALSMDKAAKAALKQFKTNAIQKRKESLLNEKKLKDIISMKDEFIQKACYKLLLYKDRLSQFEVPVFQQYVVLLSPMIHDLLRYDDGEGMPSNHNSLQHIANIYTSDGDKKRKRRKIKKKQEDDQKEDKINTTITAKPKTKKKKKKKLRHKKITNQASLSNLSKKIEAK